MPKAKAHPLITNTKEKQSMAKHAPATSKHRTRSSADRVPPAPTAAIAPAAARTTDLIGLTADGRLVLWQAAAQVRPVSAFESKGPWIVCGHYVIEWKEHAITVHCGNMANGLVSVQFMCGDLEPLYLPREEVEAMLLGQVVCDPMEEASTLRMLEELKQRVLAQNSAPHLQRGRLS